MSYAAPLSVANNFDPSVSGLSDPVGTIVETVDGTKAWMKWGTGNTQWSPLHPVTATFGVATTTWDTTSLVANLACDTLGGFKLLIQGAVSQLTNLSLRINGLATVNGEYLQMIGYNATGAVGAAASAGAFGLVSSCAANKPFVISVQTIAWKSGTQYQVFDIKVAAYSNTLGLIIVTDLLQRAEVLPQNEITSMGITSSVAGALNATVQATIIRI